MTSLEFLLTVWKHTATEGDYVFLSTKNGSSWKDHSFRYGWGIKRDLRAFLQSYPSSRYDLYFCPLPFRGERRHKNLVKDINVLWSDIDTGKPTIEPTVLWESSPARLQGLWFLNESLPAEEGAELNKALTYNMNADKGGWDITQVLRIPGTKNHKYNSLPTVRVIEEDFEKVYSSQQISRKVGHKKAEEPSHLPQSLDFEKVYSKWRRNIPSKVRRLLLQKTVATGKRSDIIWYLENKLSEAGLSPEEIILLIKNSAWNKYKGRSDEDKRLKGELGKIVESKVQDTEEYAEQQADAELSNGLRVETFFELMSALDTAPGWLVEGFWMNKSHGIVAGEPKSFKSTLAMDLGISVASGKPFLGKFPVHRQGTVLYIQNENAKWIMKDRMEKITHSKGIVGEALLSGRRLKGHWSPEIPFYTINQQSFLLTDPIHQRILEEALKLYKPELVILDPLYLMFDGDTNSAQELNPILSWLMELRYKYNCGIMLIHHYNKGSGENKRGGQRMLGSTTLHGWIESAWYIETSTKDFEEAEAVNSQSAQAEVIIGREFRGAGLFPKIDMTLTMGGFGDAEYTIQTDVHKDSVKSKKASSPESIEKEIFEMLSRKSIPTLEKHLVRDTGYTLPAIRKSVDNLCDKGRAKRSKAGIILL